MDVFAQAYSEMTGSGLQGQEALAKFYEDIAKGSIESAKILPIVARLLSERAAPKIDLMKQSSIAEQARAENAQTRLLETFSKAGGEEGFARFWRETAKIFKEMKPLVEGLGGAFNDLTRIMQPIRMVFEGWNGILKTTSELTGLSTTRLVEFAAVGGLMASKWGRVATMFTAILLVLEDVAYGVMGGKNSLTGQFSAWMQDNGMPKFASDATAVSVALGAIAAALALISRNSMLPGIGDILGRGKSSGKGSGVPEGGSTSPSKSSKFKMPWEKLGTGAAVGAVGAGAYYVGTNGLPNTNLWDSTGADLITNTAMGLWLGGPYGAAAGGIWSLGNPTWGSNLQLPRDEFGYQTVPSQNNDDLVRAMLLSRQRSSGQVAPVETNVSISVEANITAQDAQGFSENLKLEIDKALGNYNFTE